MRRVIKFRVWHARTKEMDYDPGASDGSINGIFDPKGMPDCEIMQFTGLLDRNGKEIYEGDIVITYPISPNIMHIDPFAQEVKWLNDRQNRWNIDGYQTHRVVGNIYETPELVK